MRADVVILGAGVIGASVAWHLTQLGVRDIIVVDRAPAPGGGSTAKATGGFRAQFDSAIEVQLSLLAREKLGRFADEVGADPGYRPQGYLFLARSSEEMEALRVAQRLQHACGLREARMVSAKEARGLNRVIADPTVIGGAFCPTDGFIRPMNILNGYITAAERAGARFLWDTESLPLASSGTHVTAARTSRGDIAARTFVNALGAWSGAPVVPLRRNVAATVPTTLLDPDAPMTIWSGDWYHVRERDGRVLLLWPDDPPDDEKWLAEVRRMTRERMPSLASLPIAETWSGLYEMTPDERALLGRSPLYKNVYLATGASGHGVMHSPALGHLLAEMIVKGTTSIDVRPLDPARFHGAAI